MTNWTTPIPHNRSPRRPVSPDTVCNVKVEGEWMIYQGPAHMFAWEIVDEYRVRKQEDDEMTEWSHELKHDGGPMPVAGDVLCYVQGCERHWSPTPARARCVSWNYVTAYKIPMDDYRRLLAEKVSVFEQDGDPQDTNRPGKYDVEIRPHLFVDIYDVLHAFGVTNPGDQHAIKKMLKPGQRGVKDAAQDRREAIASLERAIELEGGE